MPPVEVIAGAVRGIVGSVVSLYVDAAVYILFGLLVSGIIQAFVSKETISAHLGAPGIRSIVIAALIGVPLPLCSCGVIPTAVALRKRGASKGAVVSFLISTPESGVDSIAVSYALLDPLMTVYRPVAALISAILAGISENIFGMKEEASRDTPVREACVFCNRTGPHTHSPAARLGYGISFAFTDLLCDISLWLAIGIAAGGVIAYLLPQEFVTTYFGYSFRSMLIMLVIGIPMYICASASTPIAAALIAKGMSPGAALVLMLTGPATNMATILAITRFLGKRSALLYVASLSLCAIAAGLCLNAIYQAWHIDIRAHIGAAAEIIPPVIRISCAILLLSFMILCQRKRGTCGG